MSDIASFCGIKASTLRKSYKHKTSNFHQWEQKEHAEDYLIYPDNIGPYLSIDELSLSKGELYTYVTNKEAKGKKGSLVASIKGTLSKDIIEVLLKIPEAQRNKVEEVTLDMANNMSHAVGIAFPNAMKTTDRFHVIKLAMEALQHKRVKERWKAMDKENEAISNAKKAGVKHIPETYNNGDTPKQLLARSRYIIAKNSSEWTENQKQRAEILFNDFPEIHKAYKHVIHLRSIYKITSRTEAKKQLRKWLDRSKKLAIQEFNTVANTIANKIETILNFFKYRNTNANAESFNAKIKLFRANLRGVTDTQFFLFRLEKLFA
jgi:transposase